MHEQRERDISRHAKTSSTYLLVPDARPNPIVAIGLILGNFRVGKIVRHARAPPQLRRVANRFQRGTCTSRYRHLVVRSSVVFVGLFTVIWYVSFHVLVGLFIAIW